MAEGGCIGKRKPKPLRVRKVKLPCQTISPSRNIHIRKNFDSSSNVGQFIGKIEPLIGGGVERLIRQRLKRAKKSNMLSMVSLFCWGILGAKV